MFSKTLRLIAGCLAVFLLLCIGQDHCLLASAVAVGVTVTSAVSINGGGINIQTLPNNHTGSALIGYEESLVAATAGTLTTRTSDTAGTITVATGHGIVTGDIIDVHWTVGGVSGVAYGCTAGVVAAAPGDTAIPFTLASGDVLPAQDSVVSVSEQLSVNTNIDGDNVKYIAIILETANKSLREAMHIQFLDSGSAEIAELDFTSNVPQQWNIEGGESNPFTGNPITNAKVSIAGTSTSEQYKLKIVGVADASP